jgi:hypothetical protein
LLLEEYFVSPLSGCAHLRNDGLFCFPLVEVVEHACGMASLQMGEYVSNVSHGIDTYSIREPLGVCAGICPFNFPAMIPLWVSLIYLLLSVICLPDQLILFPILDHSFSLGCRLHCLFGMHWHVMTATIIWLGNSIVKVMVKMEKAICLNDI